MEAPLCRTYQYVFFVSVNIVHHFSHVGPWRLSWESADLSIENHIQKPSKKHILLYCIYDVVNAFVDNVFRSYNIVNVSMSKTIYIYRNIMAFRSTIKRMQKKCLIHQHSSMIDHGPLKIIMKSTYQPTRDFPVVSPQVTWICSFQCPCQWQPDNQYVCFFCFSAFAWYRSWFIQSHDMRQNVLPKIETFYHQIRLYLNCNKKQTRWCPMVS